MRALTLVNSTPSTSTVLISVPPMWPVVQQGLDPGLATNQLMAAQQQALQSEANVRHSEVMERQRLELVSEARDQLTSIEQQAADEISRKNLLLNEQAAQAMSEQKAAQLQVQAQDHRIRELSAELTHVVNNAGIATSSAEKFSSDLQAARSELAEYRTQIDAMNPIYIGHEKNG